MRTLNRSTFTLTMAATLLTACGGGGGGGGGAGTATQAPIKMTALSAPATWPENFKSVSVSQTSLISSADLALTTNVPKAIFIQIWYLNQEQQRQTLAVLTLDALTRMGGNLTIANVPRGILTLKSEVYTSSGNDQLTLASKDISV